MNAYTISPEANLSVVNRLQFNVNEICQRLFNRQWKDDRLPINQVLLHVSPISLYNVELLSYGKEEAITMKSPSKLFFNDQEPTNFLVTPRKILQ